MTITIPEWVLYLFGAVAITVMIPLSIIGFVALRALKDWHPWG